MADDDTKETNETKPKRKYINPDTSSSPRARPRARKPMKPTGRYLAKSPLEFPRDFKRQDGTVDHGRIRVEVGKTVPEDVSEEMLAYLEANGSIEAEFAEDTSE